MTSDWSAFMYIYISTNECLNATPLAHIYHIMYSDKWVLERDNIWVQLTFIGKPSLCARSLAQPDMYWNLAFSMIYLSFLN